MDIIQKQMKNKAENKSIKLSVRINGKVSSVSLRKNIVSLWLLHKINKELTELTELTVETYFQLINKFIYACSLKWEKQQNNELNKYSAKGFSDFVCSKMIQDILSEIDFKIFLKILSKLS